MSSRQKSREVEFQAMRGGLVGFASLMGRLQEADKRSMSYVRDEVAAAVALVANGKEISWVSRSC